MICTFGDTTDVTWWRELALPTRTIVGRDGRLLPVAWGEPGWESDDPATAAARLRRARRAAPSRRPRTRIVELLARRRGARRRAAARSPTRSSSTRRATGRSRSSRPGSGSCGPCRCATGCSSPGRGAALAPAVHGPPLRGLGGGPERRLEHQPPAVLRGAVPGLVPGRRRRARSTTTHPLLAAEDRLPGRPVDRRPRRLHARTSGAQPGGFVGDPDVMDTWATSSLTPQIAGGWEDDPDLFARVFPMDLRPQAHEIIRTWLFSTIVRSELEHGVAALDGRRHLGLGPRPRPQEDVEVAGATSSPRCPCSSSTAPTPCATGRPAAGRASTPPSTRAR